MGSRSSKSRSKDGDPGDAVALPGCCEGCLLCCRCGPYKVWVPNEKVPGQEHRVLADFDRMNLSLFTIRKMYGLFRKIDTDDGGTITLDEFYAYFTNIERSRLGERMFTILDEDMSGEIDFREFVTALWNVCSLNSTALGKFAFMMVDTDGSNVLDLDEVRELVDCVMPVGGAPPDLDLKVQAVLTAMDADGDGEVTCEEFLEFCSKYPVLLKPGIDMREGLRKATFGVRFWQSVEAKRWKGKKRDPLASIVKAAMSMTHQDVAAAVTEVLHVTDHPAHRSLILRRQLIERWLPDDYGGLLPAKKHVLSAADGELGLHADVVQKEIEKRRKERAVRLRPAMSGFQRGKLRRARVLPLGPEDGRLKPFSQFQRSTAGILKKSTGARSPPYGIERARSESELDVSIDESRGGAGGGGGGRTSHPPAPRSAQTGPSTVGRRSRPEGAVSRWDIRGLQAASPSRGARGGSNRDGDEFSPLVANAVASPTRVGFRLKANVTRQIPSQVTDPSQIAFAAPGDPAIGSPSASRVGGVGSPSFQALKARKATPRFGAK